MFMENNFFNYITTPLTDDEVDTWFRSNNIILEKLELFFDFCYGLNKIINDTYLGDTAPNQKEGIKMTKDDNDSHFIWCWKKNITSFENEGILFNEEGEHLTYFREFFGDIFYNSEKNEIRESIGQFLIDIFNTSTNFSKSDLDLLITIYRSLDSNMTYITLHKN